MASKKGKVGGREKNSQDVVKKCAYCGIEGAVIRVKSCGPNGAGKMIWECKKCLNG